MAPKTADLATVRVASRETGVAESTIRSWMKSNAKRGALIEIKDGRVSIKAILAQKEKSTPRKRSTDAAHKMSAGEFATMIGVSVKTAYGLMSSKRITGYTKAEAKRHLQKEDRRKFNPGNKKWQAEQAAKAIEYDDPRSPAVAVGEIADSATPGELRALQVASARLDFERKKGNLYEASDVDNVMARIVAELKDCLDRVPTMTRRLVRGLADSRAIDLPDEMLDELILKQEKAIHEALDHVRATLVELGPI